MKPAAKKIQSEFVKKVRHRLVDLDKTANQMCEELGISQSHWSECRHLKKALSIDHMVLIARHLDFDFDFELNFRKV